MIPVLYPSTERLFRNNGLGGLPHAVSCFVTEYRNSPDDYYLEMEYPVDGLHYSELALERIIYAPPAPFKRPQPFYIDGISEPHNGIVTIFAPHVSAQMKKLVTYGTHVGTNIQGMCYNYLYQARQIGQPVDFWMTTDITRPGTTTFTHPEPCSIMNVLQGKEGSILDICGGEYEFDAWHIVLHKQRGTDTNLEIRHGVNMLSMDAETDAGDLVTAVFPYWKGKVDGVETVLTGELCVSDNADSFAFMRTISLDVSSDLGMKEGETPTTAQITAAGRAFLASTSLTEVPTSFRVEYTPTDETTKRPIYLCDTARVTNPDLHVSAPTKLMATRYDVLLQRYDSLTFGAIRKTVADTIADLVKKGG